MTLMTSYLVLTMMTLSKSLQKATDTLVSVAYFFSVDYVVDVVYVYQANILYKKKLALVYTKRNLLILIRKVYCSSLYKKNFAASI